MTEAGFLSGYFANYYLRGDDQKQPDETFLTVYGSASVRGMWSELRPPSEDWD